MRLTAPAFFLVLLTLSCTGKNSGKADPGPGSEQVLVKVNSAEISQNLTMTRLDQVTVNFDVDHAREMYLTNNFGCVGGTWQAFKPEITWQLGQEQGIQRLYYKFRSATGQESACGTLSIEFDSIEPKVETFVIHGGALSTNQREVQLTVRAQGASEILLSSQPGCLDGAWQGYSGSILSWTLAATNAVNTVSLKVRDQAGNESACAAASIVHDDVPPSLKQLTINDGSSLTRDDLVSLALDAADAENMAISAGQTCLNASPMEAFAARKSFRLNQLNGRAFISARVFDRAGNASPCVTASIEHDAMGVQNFKVEVEGGPVTRRETIEVKVSAQDAVAYAVVDNASCQGGLDWKKMDNGGVTFTRKLNQLNQNSIFSVKVRDQAGNESGCQRIDILHDNMPPPAPSVVIQGLAERTGNEFVEVKVVLNGEGLQAGTQVGLSNTSCDDAGLSWNDASGSAQVVIQHKLAPLTGGETEAERRVYARTRDRAGNISDCSHDVIILDQSTASDLQLAAVGGVNVTSARRLELTLTNAPADVSDMVTAVVVGHDPGAECSELAPAVRKKYAQTFTVNLATEAEPAATRTLWIIARVIDRAGNRSNCAKTSVVWDAEKPVFSSFSVKDFTFFTAKSEIVLKAEASADGNTIYLSPENNCAAGGEWQPFQKEISWKTRLLNNPNTVSAKVRDLAGNESECRGLSYYHDDKPPVAPVVKLKSGLTAASSKLVDLVMTAPEANLIHVRNDQLNTTHVRTFSGTSAATSWTLEPTNGIAVVIAKALDEAGNESNETRFAIEVDEVAPTLNHFAIGTAANPVTEFASSYALSLYFDRTGATSYLVTENSDCQTGTWSSMPDAAVIPSYHALGSDRLIKLFLKTRDAAGNESPCRSDEIRLDRQPPKPGSKPLTFEGAGKNLLTSSMNVALLMSVSEATEMMIVPGSSCAGTSSWEAYASTKNWVLTQKNAANPVSAKFRDAAGNETVCLSMLITHDDVAPQDLNFSIDDGRPYTTAYDVTLRITSKDATAYALTRTASCGDSIWQDLPQPAGTPVTFPVSVPEFNQLNSWSIRFKDEAGNVGACLTRSITHDSMQPNIPQLILNGGQEQSKSRYVKAEIKDFGDATEMALFHNAECRGDETWQKLTPEFQVQLLNDVQGRAYLSLRIRDAAGNATWCTEAFVRVLEYQSIPESTSRRESFTNVLDIAEQGGTLFLGTYDGLLMSSDNGKTWRTRTNADGLPSQEIRTVTVTASGRILVGTRQGLAISDDQGLSWNVTLKRAWFAWWDARPEFGVHDIIQDGETIYAATDLGVYQSADSGLSWQSLDNDDNRGHGLHRIFVDKGQLYSYSDSGAAVRSLSGGTWRTLVAGQGGTIKYLAIVGEALFAVISEPSNSLWTKNGLYQSNDGGLNWQKIGVDASVMDEADDYPKEIWSIRSRLYVSLDGVVRIYDPSNASWARAPNAIRWSRNFHDNGTMLYASDLLELKSSSDGGGTWSTIPSKSQIYPATGIEHIAVASGLIVLGSSWDIHVSDDNGSSWKSSRIPDLYPTFTDVKINTSAILVGTAKDGLWIIPQKANGEGQRPMKRISGPPSSEIRNVVPFFEKIFVATAAGVTSCTLIADNCAPATIKEDLMSGLTRIAVENNRVYGTNGRDLFVWNASDLHLIQKIEGAAKGAYISDLTASGGQVYLATNHSPTSSAAGLFVGRVSESAPTEWKQLSFKPGSQIFFEPGVNRIAVKDGSIFAASNRGLYISQDAGKTWSHRTTENGLQSDQVRDVAVIGSRHYVLTVLGLSVD